MKKILFTAATAVIAVVILEVVVGYLLWLKNSSVPSSTYYTLQKAWYRIQPRPNSEIEVRYAPRSMYAPDSYLGYRQVPGSYTVTLENVISRDRHVFTLTVGPDGHRITSFAPERFNGEKPIWIFGDSYVHGWGNNDETTFPFFLQEFLPAFQIVNYADSGHGNVQSFLQLKRALQDGGPRPVMIIVVYGDYFRPRNVAAPSRLRRFRRNEATWSIRSSEFLHPRAALKDGRLTIDYVPLFSEEGHSNPDPSGAYQEAVTSSLLEEMYELGATNGARMMLAFIRGEDDDAVVAGARRVGYRVVDIRPRSDRLEWDSFVPFDGHPGPLAQNHYARKLRRAIEEVPSLATP